MAPSGEMPGAGWGWYVGTSRRVGSGRSGSKESWPAMLLTAGGRPGRRCGRPGRGLRWLARGLWLRRFSGVDRRLRCTPCLTRRPRFRIRHIGAGRDLGGRWGCRPTPVRCSIGAAAAVRCHPSPWEAGGGLARSAFGGMPSRVWNGPVGYWRRRGPTKVRRGAAVGLDREPSRVVWSVTAVRRWSSGDRRSLIRLLAGLLRVLGRHAHASSITFSAVPMLCGVPRLLIRDTGAEPFRQASRTLTGR